MTDTLFSPNRLDVRLRGKIPLVEHLPVSLAMLVRDAIVVKLKAMAFFAEFTFSTNKMLQIQPQALPFCGLYFIQEIGNPSYEPQTGPTGFRTSVRYGMSVIVINNDGEAAEKKLDRAFQYLTNFIFIDPELRDNSLFRIQAFTSHQRQHIFGNAGQNNETPIAELRFEFVADLGLVEYLPQPIDTLETIRVTTKYPYDHPDTEPVESEYDLEQ